MSDRFQIDPAKYTVVLTSCGRFDLLEDTITSFARHFAVDKVIVTEDSGDHAAAAAFQSRFGFVEMLVNDPKLGQMRSIDRLYERATTPYIIHMEDDWRFAGHCDLDKAARVLDANDDLTSVVIAFRENPKYAHLAEKRQIEGEVYKFYPLDAHPDWFSYSFNPSVVARKTWLEMGPYSRYKTEAELSQAAKKAGKRYATLARPLGLHTGDERHVPDPFQPQRAKTVWAKLVRSVRKRLRSAASWMQASK